MFDISIKILSLSDAEIYFIRPSVAAWACDGSLQSLCVIPGCHRGCLHIQQSLIKAPGRSLPALCVWGCIYEYDWLLKDNAHIWGEGVIIKTGFAPSGPPPLAHDTRIG